MADRIDDVGGCIYPLIRIGRLHVSEILPSYNADGLSLDEPSLGQQVGQRRGFAPILTQQAKGWIEPDLWSQRRARSIALILRPSNDERLTVQANN